MGTSKDELIDEIYKFKEAFSILMEYWDCIPDEAKEDINKRLKEVGL
jgi:hypothetical protein